MALIPGTVGASPVQNIGAYGLELQDRFESLDAIDLATGESFTLDAAQCAFGYRDSVFKHAPAEPTPVARARMRDRKSTRLNSSHLVISYAVFCLKKKKTVQSISYDA